MGVEAPRNSMEFLPETSSSYNRVYDNVPFSCQVKNPSKMNMTSTGLPMKKLIDEEMSRKTNSIRKAPSVIARLMGMDSLPSEANSATKQKGKSSEVSRGHIPRKPFDTQKKPHSDVYYGRHEMTRSTSPNDRRNELPPTGSTQGLISSKHRPREHPQEDILQNFKKEFEAWQANKMWEHTKAIGFNSSTESGREKIKSAQSNCKKERSLDSPDSKQRLPHEKTYVPAPSREKIIHSPDSKQTVACEKISEPTRSISGELLNLRTNRSSSRHESSMSKLSQLSFSETMSSGTRSTESGYSPSMTSREKNGKSSPSPTSIVVLKPDYENINDIDDSWIGSSASIHKQVPMDDFLEEVRERLSLEFKGKPRSNGTRGSTSNMYANQRVIPDTVETAQNIKRQIRESKNIGATLIQSESSRSHKSETQSSESASPQFTNKDVRKILTERLRRTLRSEEHIADSNVSSRRARASASVKKSTSSRPLIQTTEIENKAVDDKNSTEGKTRLSREEEKKKSASFKDVPPNNLIRSLSAPSSGTAFGKLILDDQNLLSGTHTRRKHEMTDKLSRKTRKNKKDSFNFKGRVSNLKHNLNLKGKLFGKKTHLVENAPTSESDREKIVETAAESLKNLSISQARLENPTEVPPSPASVPSWSHYDLSKPGHPSPVSPLDVPFIEEYSSSQISEEILPQIPEECSCSFPEPCITSTYETEESKELKTDKDVYEDAIVYVDNHEEAYVRDILTTSGLYERQSGSHAFLSMESLPQPLAIWVFEEVEEALGKRYREADADDIDASLMTVGEASADRKMLFDLVNEALLNVLKSFINNIGLKRNPYTTSIPYGKELFEDVLKQIQILTHLPEEEQECSLESIATYDMKRVPWTVMIQEETSGVGTEVEQLIIDQLVEEFILEFYYD